MIHHCKDTLFIGHWYIWPFDLPDVYFQYPLTDTDTEKNMGQVWCQMHYDVTYRTRCDTSDTVILFFLLKLISSSNAHMKMYQF